MTIVLSVELYYSYVMYSFYSMSHNWNKANTLV